MELIFRKNVCPEKLAFHLIPPISFFRRDYNIKILMIAIEWAKRKKTSMSDWERTIEMFGSIYYTVQMEW